MNVNMRNLCNRSINIIKGARQNIFELDYKNESHENIRECIDEYTEEINSAIIDIEWMHEQLQDFLQELKTRKAEGEVVIDELIKVLSIGEQE
ncbi:MAG: hypothetical protein NTW78_04035 [Campylobacterales bacterium]|nr:hypothetical protein [Campylobacterales bacterium]